MNKDEARIVLLEQALRQAISTIEFLDACLLRPERYRYGYPDQTQDQLREFEKLVSVKEEFCVHSGFVPGCKSCNRRVEDWDKRDEALKVLEDYGRKETK